MHTTLRFGSEILKQDRPGINDENMAEQFRWKDYWEKTYNDFEKENSKGCWIAVYYKGKPIYHFGYYHQFFDVLEHYEFHNESNSDNRYKSALLRTQDAFQKSGKELLIEQESNVGFILDPDTKEKRFAVILRTPYKKATFVVRMTARKELHVPLSNNVCMQVAADYIEGINLAVKLSFMRPEMKKLSPDYQTKTQYNFFHKQLTKITISLSQIENKYDLKYRPEKPDFEEIENAGDGN